MQAGESTSSPFVQFAIVVLVFLWGVFATIKKVASRYFSVDGGFGCAEEMSIGGGDDDVSRVEEEKEKEKEICVGCGDVGNKKCSGCKRVRYCSETCQSNHWQKDHKFKCKQMRLLQNREISPSRKITNKVLYPYDEFLKLFNSEYYNFAPCGLINCGNSCFANVVLQCLTSTKPLVAYLLGKNHTRGCVRKMEDWCFLCELQKHVQRATENSDPFSPINILSRLPNIGGNLGIGRQEDAHEFMRFAIDKMQLACLDEFGGEKFVDSTSQETTLIQHIFGGHLQSQVICGKCETVSNRNDNMMDLTVEIQGDAESLEECLDQYTAGEWLDGDNKYKCDGCKDYVKAWKRLTVHQAPNILTIALKRFQGGRFGKLNKRITFPLRLDLRPYMSGQNKEDIYDLYAVVVHLDMLNASFFGHYICYTKDHLGHWHRIDDCKVTAVEEEEVLAQGAYMLLYTRVTPRPGPLTTPKDTPNKHLSLPKMDISSLLPNGGTHHISDEIAVKEESNTSEGTKGNDNFAPASPLREDTVSLSPRHSNSREAETGISNSGISISGMKKPSKELFSRGFLDRPYRKPLDKDRRAPLSGVNRNPNPNSNPNPNPNPYGLCNGHFSNGEASTSMNGYSNLVLNGDSFVKEDIGTSTSNGGTSEDFEMGIKEELSLSSNGEICLVQNGFGKTNGADLNSNGEVSSSLENIFEENGASNLNSNGEVLVQDKPRLNDDILAPFEQNGLRQRLVHSKPGSNEENGVC